MLISLCSIQKILLHYKCIYWYWWRFGFCQIKRQQNELKVNEVSFRFCTIITKYGALGRNDAYQIYCNLVYDGDGENVIDILTLMRKYFWGQFLMFYFNFIIIHHQHRLMMDCDSAVHCWTQVSTIISLFNLLNGNLLDKYHMKTHS